MSLWSISAAKKKEEVPGTSKWIRKELFTLHDMMTKDAEQFAYSVSSEFLWIDEQMQEILKDDGENPRLLLESPQKLKGPDSPVKQLRDHALTLKSPEKKKPILKEIDLNILRLSPVRLEKMRSPIKIASPVKVNQHQEVQHTKEDEGEKEIEKYKESISYIEESISKIEVETNELTEESASNSSKNISFKSSEELSKASIELAMSIEEPVFEKFEDTKETQMDLQDKSISFELKKLPENKQDINSNESDDDEFYDASIEENSFQAIKSAIRKSIINKTKPTDEAIENSFKSATDEVALSNDNIESESKEEHDESFETIKPHSEEPSAATDPKTDERRTSNYYANSSHRESQGFALLPHREPLTVKSAKKPENNQKTRKSLFEDVFFLPSENKEKEGSTKVATSLYPILNLVDIPAKKLSPILKTRIPSPQKQSSSVSPSLSVKPKVISLAPLKSKIGSGEKPFLIQPNLESPKKSQSPMKHTSPLSNLFSSVGSTLKKAKSKFIKETQIIFDETSKIHKPPSKNNTRKISDVGTFISSEKEAAVEDLLKTNKSIISKPKDNTSSFKKQTTPELPEIIPLKPPQLESPTEESSTLNEDDEKQEILKFSPVNSIYGSLRQEMNSKSPTKLSPVKLKEDITIHRPKSLARMSLSKPQDDRDSNRKSNGRSLAAIPLDAKSNKVQSQKSFTDEQHSLKRKTQTEDDVVPNNKSQAYRKIGTKIVPPAIPQPVQDVKRQRTAEQVQNVLNKRASRVPSGINTQEERVEIKPKQTHVINSQALMKAAVLQHARLNNEASKSVNPFQPNSIISHNNIPKSPATPITTTVLPEIFSESEDDDEGSVLKDWAHSPELRNILMKQQYVDPDKVFGPIAPLHMEEIFKSTSTARLAKLKNRGSSAQWTGKDALTFQEIDSYKKKFKK